MEITDLGQQITVGNRPNDFHSFPDNWQLCSLGEITTFSQYGISSSSGGIYTVPILKMNNLQGGHLDLRDLDYIQLSKAEMESLMLNKGDLLINRTNSSDLVGKAAIYDLDGEHVFASYLVRFRLSPSVLPAFVNFFLNSEPGQRKLKLLATQGVSQANINPSVLKRRLFVPVPPILEQHRIVEILCALDRSINLTTQLISKKRDIKMATMQQLLTGKMRLPGFNGEWQSFNMADNSTLKARIGWQGLTTAEYLKQGEYYLVTGTDFIDGKINWNTCHFVDAKRYDQDKNIQLRVGDVLLTKDGTIGKVAYIDSLPGLATLNSGVFVIRPNNNRFYSLYLYYVLSSSIFDIFLKQLKAGSTISHLYQKDFVGFNFLTPSWEEQKAIATILSDMDTEIAALEQKRDKTRALKLGMMQELLTGKIRLI